jgi:lipid-A-disaccharide synthase-like uncharacterized protein
MWMRRSKWIGGLPGLLLLAAAGAWVPPAALAVRPSADAALDQLLEEDPKLAELLDRDPRLLEVLRGDPGLAARLAVRPSLVDRLIGALANPWVVFGFAAQFVFALRFLVQWIASERKRRSYVPVVFWYLSICGGLMLLTYAIQRRDPVFIAGQSLGVFIYLRNLILIYRRAGTYRGIAADRAATAASEVVDARPAEPTTAG